TAPPRYRAETNKAERLSVNFRFQAGSASFDVRARQDVERVVRFMAASKRGKHVVLFGFADNQGAEPVNAELSRKRAEWVADEVGSRGLAPEVTLGMGSALPVASNASREGREKNRRVEVWLR